MILLESWTDKILRPILEDMQNGVGEVFGLSLNSVTSTLEVFNNPIWKHVGTIATALTEGGALVILLILSCIDLTGKLLAVDGDGEARFRMFVGAGVKFGILWVAFKATRFLLGGIYHFFNNLAVATRHLIEESKPQGGDITPFLDSVKDLDWLGQTVLVVLMLLAWLVYRGACLAGIALVLMRFIKLYIYNSFSPVPMALLSSEHSRSFGINFIRTYAATALQAFVIVMAVGIFQLLSASWGADAIPSLDDGGVAAAFSLGGMYIFMGIVLGMLLLGSGRIANELLGG
ncbi:type IV secretion system protein [Arachnia propionica]|uniref:TrbL/VirB6 plasmid conjugal transfer protein n=1 Tax=Arachnia propionica TaxID=1750 RepID=A0A3P1WWW7_9ACTN|nr:type IV secretion system protein [Arachnia propionica]RRD50536.1 hypothetical protein EII35_03805 [Arachnia propionica]